MEYTARSNFACDTGLFPEMEQIGRVGLALAALAMERQLHPNAARRP